MRMWMVKPSLLCRRHLLGEHVECHMLASVLRSRSSIAGYLTGGLVEPQNLERRHRALAQEMRRRGYKHTSPLPRLPKRRELGKVNVSTNKRELARRCRGCRANLNGKTT